MSRRNLKKIRTRGKLSRTEGSGLRLCSRYLLYVNRDIGQEKEVTIGVHLTRRSPRSVVRADPDVGYPVRERRSGVLQR